MPNGVRARGNSRVANQRRNQQRDIAVRAELVQEAPPIVVEAEPLSDPNTIQQLQQRISELEQQVRLVKQNYKSAKKARDENEQIIGNMSHYFQLMSELMDVPSALHGPGTIADKTKWCESFLVNLKVAKDKANQCDTWHEKYQKACDGTLLAFQETEIMDLQAENDKLRKLNKNILSNKQRDKSELDDFRHIIRKYTSGEWETAEKLEYYISEQHNIIRSMSIDFYNVIDKMTKGRKKVQLDNVSKSTAKMIQLHMEEAGLGQGIVYKFNPKTKDVYADHDGELLGKLITKNGNNEIKWL